MLLNYTKWLLMLMLVVGISSGCQPSTETDEAVATVTEDTLQVDTLYLNANVWTGDSEQPMANQFAVNGDRLIYVGDIDQANIKAKATIDLQGQFVMPGFIDNHVHFFDGGYGLASVDLRDAATQAEFSKRIVEHSKSLPVGRWITIGNWDHTLWGGELPHRSWIDEGTENTPVFVSRLDGHMALANSAALKLAGIDESTPVPEGGEVILDDQGKLSGVLKDQAMLLVLNAIPKPTEAETIEIFELAQAHALSLGLTQVHAVTGNPTETEMFEAFKIAKDAGVMKIRAKVFTPMQAWEKTAEQISKRGQGDEVLALAGVKGMVDGSLGSGTAWFKEPFSDEPDNSGFPLIQPNELRELLKNADKAGLHLAIHAIGDRAIDELLGIYADLGGEKPKDKRFRIEHFQHPSSDAIDKLAELGVIASSHPYHAIDDGRWLEKRIGSDRAKTTYAFRSILDAGGILSFGSDWPVAPLNPLLGVYAAVTRQTLDGKNQDGWQPQEKITLSEALRAYTSASAYSVFDEDVAGTLKQGMRADFVVLSADPFAVEPAQIRDLSVVATVIGGELVFGKLRP